MAQHPVATLTKLASASLGVFRGRDAVAQGVTRNQLGALLKERIIAREFPDTYRMTVVHQSSEQRLRGALMWAGPKAVADGLSAGETYCLEGVRTRAPAIVVPRTFRGRPVGVMLRRTDDRAALMVRQHRGIPTTGIEPTLVALAHLLDGEAFEIACEDARRRDLTSVAALRAYLRRHGRPGRRGVAAMRELLAALDPVHPSRSTLEVKTRRLLVAHGMTDFVREFPLAWNDRTYFFDFCFEGSRAILETNGKRWHNDPADYEDQHEKWSVPGRHGYRMVFATWNKVTRAPGRLLDELRATLAA